MFHGIMTSAVEENEAGEIESVCWGRGICAKGKKKWSTLPPFGVQPQAHKATIQDLGGVLSPTVEKLYLTDLMKACEVLRYRHPGWGLCIKVTDDLLSLEGRTDKAQDVKKTEKFHSQLMKLMVAKESCSIAMETE